MELKPTWREWHCDLHNEQKTMAEILATLPGNPPEDIHWLIRLLERPTSPLALSGAAHLDTHDCIHIVLGRGLLPQDEAFVLGFTMGAASGVRFWEPAVLRLAARYFYPSIYKFTNKQIAIFNLGFEAAKQSACRDIHKFDFKKYENLPLGKIRAMLKIDPRKLIGVYKRERQIIPDSTVSRRLDIQPWGQSA
jgi:hypothetical protein